VQLRPRSGGLGETRPTRAVARLLLYVDADGQLPDAPSEHWTPRAAPGIH